MAQEKEVCVEKKARCVCGGGAGGAVYGLGFIGAVVYFIQQSDTFWIGVVGVLKAIIWPVLVTYKLLGFFNL